MSDNNKKIDKRYTALPFENEVGLSTFDLDMIHRHRKKEYVPVFKRKEQIHYDSGIKDSLAA